MDLFPILPVDEIYNILNKQLNYKMITIERLKKVNYTRNKDDVFLIDFYKNFIFDYQLSGIKPLDPLEFRDEKSYLQNHKDFAINMQLLHFIQHFFPSLGIEDFKITDLYNCGLNGENSKRLIRVMSCLINFIRFSQERLKDVSHLIDQIDIQNKLDMLQSKISNLETDDKQFLLNSIQQLKLNNVKRNKELEEINKQKLALEIENLKTDISIKNEELAAKTFQTDSFNDLVDFLDFDIINNLLSNDINKNLIRYKNYMNQRKQDVKTINELETFARRNETIIKDLNEEKKRTLGENNSSNTEISNSDQTLDSLKLIYEFLSYEKDIPHTLLTKIKGLQKQSNPDLSLLLPNWKNIMVKKQNLLHLAKINLLNKLNYELENTTNTYYRYKEDIIIEYDKMNEEMNDYVQNIIEYL